MERKKTEDLLHKLNFGTSYLGYPTTVYLICLAAEHLELVPRPTFYELCRITGNHFHIKPSQVSDNLKTMLKNYCNYKENLERFQNVIGYRVDQGLTNKEFVYEVAAYLKRQG